jgi:hypothetical protein
MEGLGCFIHLGFNIFFLHLGLVHCAKQLRLLLTEVCCGNYAFVFKLRALMQSWGAWRKFGVNRHPKRVCVDARSVLSFELETGILRWLNAAWLLMVFACCCLDSRLLTGWDALRHRREVLNGFLYVHLQLVRTLVLKNLLFDCCGHGCRWQQHCVFGIQAPSLRFRVSLLRPQAERSDFFASLSYICFVDFNGWLVSWWWVGNFLLEWRMSMVDVVSI